MYNIKENTLTYGRGYVYKLQYHIVWCTKYRKGVLTGDVEENFKRILTEEAQKLGFIISAMECMPDYVHLLVTCSPQHFIPTLIKILKGNSAIKLFNLYPDLKNQLYGGHLWNPSYFVSTVSETSEQEIEEYINSQKIK